MKKFGPYRGYSYPKKPEPDQSAGNQETTTKRQKAKEPVPYNNKLTLKELGRRYESLLEKHNQLSEALDSEDEDSD